MEQCDDGNYVAGDGCSNTCQVEPKWACSEGTSTTITTWNDFCGDGFVITRSVPSYCDDGNKISGDGWNSSWLTEAKWTWTGGTSVTPDACQDIWGDGFVVQVLKGYWDDGNLIDGDGCNSTWAIEDGYYCTAGSDTSASFCKKNYEGKFCFLIAL